MNDYPLPTFDFSRMAPLHMVWPTARLAEPPALGLHPDYLVRTYQPGDEACFLELSFQTGFCGEFCPGLTSADAPDLAPDGFFFAIHRASGQAVGTLMAIEHPTPRHPEGVEMGWLAVDPEHRGHGLGHALLAYATTACLARGARDLYLKTNENLLVGISIYLRMGYAPLLYAEDMAGRWERVCRAVDYPFTPEAWPRQADREVNC